MVAEHCRSATTANTHTLPLMSTGGKCVHMQLNSDFNSTNGYDTAILACLIPPHQSMAGSLTNDLA